MLYYSTLVDIGFGTIFYMYGPSVLPMLGAGGPMWLAIYSFGAAFAFMQLGASRMILRSMAVKDEMIM